MGAEMKEKKSNSRPSSTSKPNLPGSRSGEKSIAIAARIKGPGPAAYRLPSTLGKGSIERNKAPAYSFGIKTPSKQATITPGPNSFFPINTRKGIMGGPAFSIQGGYKKKRRDGRDIVMQPATFQNRNGEVVPIEVPGPGLCEPPNPQATKERSAPKFSISGRYHDLKGANNPGPAKYSIRSTVGTSQVNVGSSPAFTVMLPRPPKLLQISPGPAAHHFETSNVVSKAAPAYSLGTRSIIILTDKKHPTPGPGAYTPQNATWRASPSYSFRFKHSEYEHYVPEVEQQ